MNSLCSLFKSYLNYRNTTSFVLTTYVTVFAAAGGGAAAAASLPERAEPPRPAALAKKPAGSLCVHPLPLCYFASLPVDF